MFRRLFNFASVLSLLVAGGLIAIVIWGLKGRTWYAWARDGSRWDLIVNENCISVLRIDGWPRDERFRKPEPPDDGPVIFGGPADARTDFWFARSEIDPSIGFSIRGPNPSYRFDTYRLPPPRPPHTYIELTVFPKRCLPLALILPIAWLTTARPRWRPGLCRVCLYDLRGSAERCPECGTPITDTPHIPFAPKNRDTVGFHAL